MTKRNCAFWVQNELQYAYEGLSRLFCELDFVATVDVFDRSGSGERAKQGPASAPLSPKEILRLREDLVFYATRLRGVHQVMINETTCTTEEWNEMVSILLDSMESKNPCNNNPFYQARNVIDLGLKIRKELLGPDIWYGVEGESKQISSESPIAQSKLET